MSLMALALTVVFVVASACMGFGCRSSTGIDDALIRSTAETVGGIALAGDLTGWLIYLAV
jgi:hypothetical protein